MNMPYLLPQEILPAISQAVASGQLRLSDSELEERLAAMPVARRPKLGEELMKAFPELPLSPYLLAKFWTLYESFDICGVKPAVTRDDMVFIFFVLGVNDRHRRGGVMDSGRAMMAIDAGMHIAGRLVRAAQAH